MTTYTTFIQGLRGLTITGVNEKKKQPPRSVRTAELPASFVRFPAGTEGPLTFDGEGGWPEFNGELVVLIEAVEQNLHTVNFDDAVTMIDNINTALRAVTPGSLCKSKINWSISQTFETIGDTTFWAVVASVTGHG